VLIKPEGRMRHAHRPHSECLDLREEAAVMVALSIFGRKRAQRCVNGNCRLLLVEPLEGRRVLAGISVVESGGTTVTEAGGTDTVAVALTEAPASNVVLNISSSDTTEVIASPVTLTFTPANWNVAQNVTLLGMDDSLLDGSQPATITISVNDTTSDDLYDSVPDHSIAVSTLDNDVAGLNVVQSGGTTFVGEAGTTDTLAISLMAQPLSSVVLNVASADTGEVTASPTTLTFTSANWNVAQNVTLTGVDDAAVDGNQTTNVTLSVVDASSDNAFDSLVDQIVGVTTTDNDAPTGPGFVITQSAGGTIVSETGTTDTFTVALTAQPTSNVVLDIASGDIAEATVVPTALTFTPANWNIPQTVTVTGVNDALADGSQTTTITATVNDALSADAFDAIGNQTVNVTTLDDEVTAPSPGTAVLVPDPDSLGSQMLVVTGTSRNDTIRIRMNDEGELIVRINGQREAVFPADGISRIQIFGERGNDDIHVAGDVTIPVELDGGRGNDRLRGGGGDDLLTGGLGNDRLEGGQGNDLLRGEQGNDRLSGNAGNDILLGAAGNDHLAGGGGLDMLIGGGGNDKLSGEGGEDILIGGTTEFDDDDEALLMLLSEWSSDRSFDDRVENLAEGIEDILEGTGLSLDEGSTVLTAGRDKLDGGGGQDLIFSLLGKNNGNQRRNGDDDHDDDDRRNRGASAADDRNGNKGNGNGNKNGNGNGNGNANASRKTNGKGNGKQ
jgi:hypothetical protein